MIGGQASSVELLPMLSRSSSLSETASASPPEPLPSQGRAHAKPPRPSDGLYMSYTEIFHILVGQGLITPLLSDTVEPFVHSDPVFLQSCEYHKGRRGHSTEDCIELRFLVQKLMEEGLVKIEPPKLVVADQNNSSVHSPDKISRHDFVEENYDRLLQEMNFSDDQRFGQQKAEKNIPQRQISKKQEHTSDPTVPKEEYDQVFQEINSLKNQLSLIRSEFTLGQTKGEKGASSNNKEQQSLPTTYSSAVGDMIGARASPVEVSSISSSNGETPPASPLQPLPSQGSAHAKEEMNMPHQISKKQEHSSDQTVPKEEYDRVFQEMNSLKNQLSLISREFNLLKRISEQTTGNILSQNRSAEQQSQPATCFSIVHKYLRGDKRSSVIKVFLALYSLFVIVTLVLSVIVKVRHHVYST